MTETLGRSARHLSKRFSTTGELYAFFSIYLGFFGDSYVFPLFFGVLYIQIT